MRALVLNDFNGPLELTDLPRPTPAEGQVLVHVQACGLNPLDAKIRAGAAPHAKHPLPAILGMDLAGIVEDSGSGATEFQAGEEVYGMTGGVGGIPGALAEYAAVSVDLIARKPSRLSMREAAALPLAFITSYSGLVDRAHLRAGQTALVLGGAGGVGHVAIQLARAVGATVFATGGRRDRELLTGLGATPIDYEREAIQDYVINFTGGKGFDVILDTVGGLDSAFAAVKHYGHVASALGWGTHALGPLSFREASYSGIFTLHALLTGENRAHHGEMLRIAGESVQFGALSPIVDPRRFALADAELAYHAVLDGSARVKIVVEMR